MRPATSNRSSEERPRLPVAVVGAGPIGLAAAAHLIRRGEMPLVLEAGPAVADSVRQWGHVRLFSPWKYLVDPVAAEMLVAAGWSRPPGDELPTGRELVERYLEPLAALPAVAASLRLGRRVVAISRRGFDKAKSAGREQAPFELVVENAAGERQHLLARSVIDASGTWGAPNPLGASGVPAPGEREAAAHVHYGIPDALGTQRERYRGKHTVVVGSGHSAFNAVFDLVELARRTGRGRVTWAIRRADVGLMFGGGPRDALAARGQLGDRLRRLVDSGAVTLVRGFRAQRLRAIAQGAWLDGEAGESLGPVDEIVVATGFRPDLETTRELRLALDSWLECPAQLAPLIDPNVHSCGTVYPHGAAELAHPEKDFFVVGMKSYGRAPTFLLLTGYEQVRSVVCALVGDERGAREVRLVLPETGVCSTDLASPCCGSGEPEAPVALGASCGVASACASPAAAAAEGSGTAAESCCG